MNLICSKHYTIRIIRILLTDYQSAEFTAQSQRDQTVRQAGAAFSLPIGWRPFGAERRKLCLLQGETPPSESPSAPDARRRSC